MQLTAEQIQQNWIQFLGYINDHITSPRKEKLVEFYEKFEDRLILMPAAHKKEYHNAFPGGYIDHVNRVVKGALHLHDLWGMMGADLSTYTKEELVFAALNHDLGKMGSEEEESYIPQTDEWRRNKLGENYMFNNKVPFASVPDRSLFLLQSHSIPYSFNEMITIQTHDGLYDEGNKKYLIGFMPEQRPRTSLPFIVHQADLMAARIEFEHEWLPKFNLSLDEQKKKYILESNKKYPTPSATKQKALGSVKSEGLKNLLDNL